jgi:hypothetical protein
MNVGRNHVSVQMHRAAETEEAYTSDKKSPYCIRTIKEKTNMCFGYIWHSQGQEEKF